MVKISVIVPVYNVENYLEDCINSIINQTLKDIEIILVNDGSTDGSLDILEKYEKIDKRIIVINKENGGQSSARNEGLKIAKGEYIGFVDSDDFISEDMYEELYKKIGEEIDLIVCGRRVLKDGHKVTGEVLLRDEEIEVNDIGSYLIDNLVYKQTVVCYNKLYKREILRKNNIFFEDVSKVGSEDALFNYCYILNCKKVRTTSKGIYIGNEREGSTTREYKIGSMNRTGRLIEAVYKISKEFNLKEEELKKVIVIFINFFQQWNYNYIKNYGDINLKRVLREEHKAANGNIYLKMAEKEIVFNRNSKKYLKDLGYGMGGVLFLKAYMFFSYMRWYRLAANIRGII